MTDRTLTGPRAWSVWGYAVLAVLAAGCGGPDTRVARVNEAAMSLAPEADRAETFAAAIGAWHQEAAGQPYPIGPGDVLQVQIYELEDLNKSEVLTLQVGSGGQVRLPLIGAVTAAGLTTDGFRAVIEKRLAAEYMVDPQVSVAITEYHGRQVAVMGAVAKPGVFTLRRNAVTLLDALALAGGLNERAGQYVYVTRGPRARLLERSLEAVESARAGAEGQTPGQVFDAEPDPPDAADTDEEWGLAVDVIRLLEQGDPQLNVTVTEGDVIHVPEAESFYVTGMVVKPGGYALKRPTTILEAVAMAGGIREDASPEYTRLIRMRGGRRQVLAVDLERIAVREQENVLIGPNDMVIVRQTPSKKFWHDVGETFRGIFGVGFSLGSL